MMLFKKIKLQNIRSYENSEIEFPQGSVLLSGDIGSGKTSVLLAIEFALFGLQPGQRGSSLLKNGKDSGKVCLELEIDGRIYNIERTLKRTSKTVSQDSTLFIDDEGKREMSVTELKNLVLTLLNYPLEFAKKTNLLYRFTVYTPQEGMKQIIIENPETRLNTLRHIFGVDKYKRIKENSSVLVSKIREEIRNKEGHIYDLEQKKENLDSKKNSFELLKKQIQELETDFEKKKKQREDFENQIKEIEIKIDKKNNLEKEVEKSRIMILNKNENKVTIEKEISEIRSQYEQALGNFEQEEFEKIIKSLDEKKLIKEKLNKELIEVSGKIRSIEMRKDQIFELKNRIKDLVSCPTCMQDVSDSHKNKMFQQIDSELGEVEKRVEKLIAEKSESDSKIQNLKSEITGLENKRSDLNAMKIRIESLKERYNKLEELEKQKQILDKDIDILEKQIDSLKQDIFDLKKFENIYNVKKQELNEKILQEKQVEIKKAEANHELKLSEKEILDLEKEIQEKQDIKKKLDNSREIERWITNEFLSLISFTERNVLTTLRGQFTKLFNEWFSVLVPENFVVHLDEDFTPIIEQQDYQLDYSYLSGGERTAIALAYRLSLNQTINSLLSRLKTRDIVILDEPTDGFSDQQLDKMRDVLHQLNVGQLILVSHEQKIEGFVDNIIRFKKENGITNIEI